jgi:hypothetical protein
MWGWKILISWLYDNVSWSLFRYASCNCNVRANLRMQLLMQWGPIWGYSSLCQEDQFEDPFENSAPYAMRTNLRPWGYSSLCHEDQFEDTVPYAMRIHSRIQLLMPWGPIWGYISLCHEDPFEDTAPYAMRINLRIQLFMPEWDTFDSCSCWGNAYDCW